jgi:cation transport ATPase
VAHRRQHPLALIELDVTLSLLVCGGAAYAIGAETVADTAWATATAIGLAAATWWTVASVRRHLLGADVVAVLALVGTLVIGEYFAGAVIAVMLGTGRALEARASARARAELRALRERAPRFVHRVEGDALASRSVEEVQPGDLLLVQPGEIVPVDGRLADVAATLDGSALTGRSTGRRSPVSRFQSIAVLATTSAAVSSTPEVRSRCGRRLGPRTARTPASCDWPPRPRQRPPALRSFGSPTGTRPTSWP